MGRKEGFSVKVSGFGGNEVVVPRATRSLGVEMRERVCPPFGAGCTYCRGS